MNLLAAISSDSLVQAAIWIVVAGLVYWLVTWFIGAAGIPEPFNKVARVLVALFALLICLNALLGMVGHGFYRW